MRFSLLTDCCYVTVCVTFPSLVHSTITFNELLLSAQLVFEATRRYSLSTVKMSN